MLSLEESLRATVTRGKKAAIKGAQRSFSQFDRRRAAGDVLEQPVLVCGPQGGSHAEAAFAAVTALALREFESTREWWR